MDTKITKTRLGHLLSYDWLKIVAVSVAAIFVWVLIFTMTATRITSAQTFTVVNYFGNAAMPSGGKGSIYNAYKENVFSYEVIETSQVDAPASGEYGHTVLEARMSTSEGDVVFVPNVEDASSEYEVTVNGVTEKKRDTYLQQLLSRYGYQLFKLDPNAEDGYFKSMERFLNRYYENDYKGGQLNESLVEQDFLARIQKNKDKRFKTDAQIEQGIQDEIKRIQKYRDALIEFYGYVNEGLVAFTSTAIYDHETGEVSPIYNGIYSINLCPNKDTMGELKNVAYYYETVKNEEGNDVLSPTALNMNVAFLNFEDTEDSFEYENLLYVNYVIRSVKTQG